MSDAITAYAAELARLIRTAEEWRNDGNISVEKGIAIDRLDWEALVRAAGNFPQPAAPRFRWLAVDQDTGECEEGAPDARAAALAWLEESPNLELCKEWIVQVAEWRENAWAAWPRLRIREWSPGDEWWQLTGHRVRVTMRLGVKSEMISGREDSQCPA